MIALTQEKCQKRINWLNARISSMEETRDEIPFGLSEDEEMELAAYKDSLASLTAEPVGVITQVQADYSIDGVFTNSEFKGRLELGVIPKDVLGCVFTSPPVPEIKLPSINRYEKYLGTLAEEAWRDFIVEIKRLNGLGE